jgi:hypothetical protein
LVKITKKKHNEALKMKIVINAKRNTYNPQDLDQQKSL